MAMAAHELGLPLPALSMGWPCAGLAMRCLGHTLVMFWDGHLLDCPWAVLAIVWAAHELAWPLTRLAVIWDGNELGWAGLAKGLAR